MKEQFDKLTVTNLSNISIEIKEGFPISLANCIVLPIGNVDAICQLRHLDN